MLKKGICIFLNEKIKVIVSDILMCIIYLILVSVSGYAEPLHYPRVRTITTFTITHILFIAKTRTNKKIVVT